ncbi:MAG TPA: M81 family metallopeptidase, partial [Candidatus Acidoferrum sp.]|nr:M81 family metallopeptidase [Candidatus Acidoferrum sp.]
MLRVLVAECKQEVASFNPVLSHYEDFRVAFGDEVLARHRGVRSEMAGALHVLESRPELRVVPAYSARSITSGGILTAGDFQRIAREFLDSVRAAGPVDALYFALHGAMASENEDDPEGHLLAETRKIVGERVPVVVSLDLHGILTDRMLQHADAVVMYHTYPHVDFYETGERAARLLMRVLAGEVNPVTAVVTIPALVRGDELITETGLLGGIIRTAQAIEKSPGGLVAGMFIGNPFTDVAGL